MTCGLQDPRLLAYNFCCDITLGIFNRPFREWGAARLHPMVGVCHWDNKLTTNSAFYSVRSLWVPLEKNMDSALGYWFFKSVRWRLHSWWVHIIGTVDTSFLTSFVGWSLPSSFTCKLYHYLVNPRVTAQLNPQCSLGSSSIGSSNVCLSLPRAEHST